MFTVNHCIHTMQMLKCRNSHWKGSKSPLTSPAIGSLWAWEPGSISDKEFFYDTLMCSEQILLSKPPFGFGSVFRMQSRAVSDGIGLWGPMLHLPACDRVFHKLVVYWLVPFLQPYRRLRMDNAKEYNGYLFSPSPSSNPTWEPVDWTILLLVGGDLYRRRRRDSQSMVQSTGLRVRTAGSVPSPAMKQLP